MSGQIGTGIEFYSASGGAGAGGKFGIEDNASTVDRTVDMGGKSLSLNNIKEFALAGSETAEFVPYQFDEGTQTSNMEFYPVVPFPGYPNNSLIMVQDETVTAGAYDITAYFDIDGVEQEFTYEFFLFDGGQPVPVYMGPILEGENITLLGYDKLVISPVDILANLPEGEITEEKIVFVDADNKLKKGILSLVPSWMDTLNQDAGISGNVYSYMTSGAVFRIYGDNAFSPVFIASNNTNPILAKFEIGVGANGFLEVGIRFYNDRMDIRKPMQYLLDDNSWMVQFDRTIPDSGFVRGQWSYAREIVGAGASSLGSKDYFVELFPDADYNLSLSGVTSEKGKKYLIRNSGTFNVILDVPGGTINAKPSILIVPGVAVEVIHNGSGWTVLWASGAVTNSDLNAAQTAIDLNILYPDAFDGFEVFCPNIAPPVLYRKTAIAGQWIAFEPSQILE